MTDEKLIECSPAATGIYIRIMCVLHKQDIYGVLVLKQKHKQNDDQIKNFASQFAQYLPWHIDVIESGLRELITEGVLLIGDGYLYQKRMSADGEISMLRAESGKNGGLKTQSNFALAKIEAKKQANSGIGNDNINNKENKELQKVLIPTEQEFLTYGLSLVGGNSNFEFPIIAKYNQWKDNKWKMASGRQIKNWKNALQNTIPHLKPFKPNGQTENIPFASDNDPDAVV